MYYELFIVFHERLFTIHILGNEGFSRSSIWFIYVIYAEYFFILFHVNALSYYTNLCMFICSLPPILCDQNHLATEGKINSNQEFTLARLFLSVCQEQGAWRGEQTSDAHTLTHNKHLVSQATPIWDTLTSANVLTSDEVKCAMSSEILGVSKIPSSPIQQAYSSETTLNLHQEERFTKPIDTTLAVAPGHLTHTLTPATDTCIPSNTEDTHPQITNKPQMEKTEPLATSRSLVSTDALELSCLTLLTTDIMLSTINFYPFFNDSSNLFQ